MRYRLAIWFLAGLMMPAYHAWGSVEGVAYGPDPAQKLDICTPAMQAARAPALLMIHGGGCRGRRGR